MLLGIGFKVELEEKGIEVIYDLLGVGKNLYDYFDVILVVKSKKKLGIVFNFVGIIKLIIVLFKYVLVGKGWLVSLLIVVGGFIKILLEKECLDV